MSFLAKNIIKSVSTFIMNEYRFYVDFKGMLYFEDSKDYIYPNSIKDKKFITQFYQHLTPTKAFLQNKKLTSIKEPQSSQKLQSLQKQIERNKDYPYVAEFWGERNYLKYGISPIIYNRIVPKTSVPELQLSEEYQNADLLEFSFGQYSLFNAQQIVIDSQGKLWHPFIKLPKAKTKRNTSIQAETKNIQKTGILGVFSNQLIAQMLNQITYENGSVFLSFKGTKIKIQQKHFDSPIKTASEIL